MDHTPKTSSVPNPLQRHLGPGHVEQGRLSSPIIPNVPAKSSRRSPHYSPKAPQAPLKSPDLPTTAISTWPPLPTPLRPHPLYSSLHAMNRVGSRSSLYTIDPPISPPTLQPTNQIKTNLDALLAEVDSFVHSLDSEASRDTDSVTTHYYPFFANDDSRKRSIERMETHNTIASLYDRYSCNDPIHALPAIRPSPTTPGQNSSADCKSRSSNSRTDSTIHAYSITTREPLENLSGTSPFTKSINKDREYDEEVVEEYFVESYVPASPTSSSTSLPSTSSQSPVRNGISKPDNTLKCDDSTYSSTTSSIRSGDDSKYQKLDSSAVTEDHSPRSNTVVSPSPKSADSTLHPPNEKRSTPWKARFSFSSDVQPSVSSQLSTGFMSPPSGKRSSFIGAPGRAIKRVISRVRRVLRRPRKTNFDDISQHENVTEHIRIDVVDVDDIKEVSDERVMKCVSWNPTSSSGAMSRSYARGDYRKNDNEPPRSPRPLHNIDIRKR
ncbi:hypothetical protein SeLEV6574_g02902 [Synchytrium endobioticum]|uniref:Uncharacterized protein n=1 Tax=Synchytrium endobioticum TaxID=286115 RepID=A0A507D6G7_9FUNG|nr:hypothetical protein SeLEV6574_g02902 [Synchytrium endobioticum]